MWKRGLSILLVLVLAGIFTVSVAWAGGEEDSIADQLSWLQERVGELEKMVKSIVFDTQKLESLESIVKEISFQMKGDEGRLRDLEIFRQGIDQDLRPRIIKLESSVSGLNFTVQKQGEKLTKLEGLSDVVAELQPRVFSLETTVEGLAAKLKTAEEQLKALDGITDKVADLGKRLAKLEETVAAISPKGIDLSGIKELRDKVFVLQNALADLAAKVDGGKLAELDSRLNQVESQVTSLAQDVSGLHGQIDDLEKRLSAMRNLATMSVVAAVAALVGVAYLLFAK